MSQQFPKNWPELPDSVTYLKEKSEQYSIQSEPEFILESANNVQILIRVYEEGDKEIIPYDIRNPVKKRIDKNKDFSKTLKKLYKLMRCELLHSPETIDIQYRGYDPDDKSIIELTRENKFVEKGLKKGSILSFKNADVNSTRMQNKGEYIATIKVKYSNSSSSEISRTRELYENVLIEKGSDGKIIDISPIPNKSLIYAALSESIDSNQMEIENIKDELKSKVLSQNI